MVQNFVLFVTFSGNKKYLQSLKKLKISCHFQTLSELNKGKENAK